MSTTAETIGLFLGAYSLGFGGGLAFAFFILPYTAVKRCSEIPL